MRALVGAIITAGAMIGLGLTALGIGQRYSSEPAFQRTIRADATVEPGKAAPVVDEDPKPVLVKLSWMDRPLIFILVFITSVAVIGLGITIFGLAYHHMRRDREYQFERDRLAVPHTSP
jgi:hypothetical protein